MKDEIKEILDNPKILMLSYGNYISLDDYVKLKDYITNLQERNEKTIEYIKNSLNNPQPFYEYIFGDEDGRVVNLDKLLNILGGDDNE